MKNKLFFLIIFASAIVTTSTLSHQTVNGQSSWCEAWGKEDQKGVFHCNIKGGTTKCLYPCGNEQ